MEDFDPAVREKKGTGKSMTRHYATLGVGPVLGVREKSEVYETH